MKRILFIVPYPHGKAPSQRFRFEQYFDVLKAAGIEYDVQSFIDEETWAILYLPGNVLSKAKGIMMGFLRRLINIPKAMQYDVIFIHREASPIGPPIFEFIYTHLFNKKVIYDFDDAIWLPSISENNKMAKGLKCYWKVQHICKWVTINSCGNQYLANYARQFNSKSIVNPTTIDTNNLHNKTIAHDTMRPKIGWTGTHTTVKYIDLILKVLLKLEEQYDFDFILISNQAPDFKMKSLQFIPWNKSTEIEDLMKINIGIMPLTDDIWAEGKCGFKGLQYMSLGIATIMSPVGVNNQIVQDGINGYLASTEDEWYTYLERLIVDSALRMEFGKQGQKTVLEHYSVVSNQSNFLALFE